MGYKVLYRKYRPTNFNELVGQTNIKNTLVNAIIKNQLSHAYIFTGPRGTGKTSMAKIFAKALTCLNPTNGICCNECVNCLSFNENPDIVEIDAASNNGVDEIREIRNNVKLVPTMSKYKIYIVDEVHMLSNSAWNAFLKTLEEPPSHVIFIFATTEINKIPVTVLSRCQRFDFHKILKQEIKDHLINISIKENLKISEEALNELVKLSDGCLRDALSYLDQLSKISSNIDLQLVSNTFGIVSSTYVKDLLVSVYNSNINEFLEKFDNILFDGIDCNMLINNMIDYLLNESIKVMKHESDLFDFDFCYNLINDLFKAQKNIKYIDSPFNVLEILLLNYFNINKNKDKIINNKLIKPENVNNKIISREIILEKEEKLIKNISQNNSNIKKLDKLKEIRINNVFCGANKKLKTSFITKWNEFLTKINENNNYTLLTYIENLNIEVVSDSYILFSAKDKSDAIIFNNNLYIIETEFHKCINDEYKFIALDEEEWIKEKTKFIQNKDIERKIISEDILKEDVIDSTVDVAQNIFGDIIEVN